MSKRKRPNIDDLETAESWNKEARALRDAPVEMPDEKTPTHPSPALIGAGEFSNVHHNGSNFTAAMVCWQCNLASDVNGRGGKCYCHGCGAENQIPIVQ